MNNPSESNFFFKKQYVLYQFISSPESQYLQPRQDVVRYLYHGHPFFKLD